MFKKYLTIDDLVRFCKENNFTQFDAQDSGYHIGVAIPSTFTLSDSDSQLLFGNVKLLHTGRNRNGSNATLKGAKNCLSGIPYKPVLANFAEFDDGLDFTSHDMEIDKDGNVTYIERQVGCFTADKAYIEHDDEKDRDYVFAKVAIPREYSPAAEIIERKGGTKVSAELMINKMSYDALKQELLLEEFEVMGVTLLGRNPETGDEVKEGMESAHLDIQDFSVDEKIDIIQEIKNLLDNYMAFNAKESKEGGETEMNLFDTLLEQYNVTVDDITFEYQDLSDDELRAKFEEVFATPEEPQEEEQQEEYSLKYSITVGDVVKEFSLTLSDTLSALSSLVNETYSESDNAWYSVDADSDKKVVYMFDMWNNKAYRQSYKIKNDVFSLTGDRVEVFSKWMTADEIKEFESMKANYSEISSELTKFKEEPQKMEILESAEYDVLNSNEEFASLKEQANHFDLSIEEVSQKADEILLNAVKHKNVNFAVAAEDKKVTSKSVAVTKTKKKNYGNLLNDFM